MYSSNNLQKNSKIKGSLTIAFDKFIKIIKMLFCWNYPLNLASFGFVDVWNIPILQYLICIFWTLFTFFPTLIGGSYGLYIFQGIVMVYMSLYLLIRFSYITSEHEKITECDVWIIQTVAFILMSDYLYNGIITTSIKWLENINSIKIK